MAADWTHDSALSPAEIDALKALDFELEAFASDESRHAGLRPDSPRDESGVSHVSGPVFDGSQDDLPPRRSNLARIAIIVALTSFLVGTVSLSATIAAVVLLVSCMIGVALIRQLVTPE